MSAATAKKPPAAGVGRVSSTDSASNPSASPARTPTRSSTPTAASAARRAPARSGTPVSARAAATRRDSVLSNSNGNGSSEAEEAARAETLALLDDLKERLSKAEISSDQYRKQVEVLQTRLDDAIKESSKLEEKVHETEEQIESLKNEKRDAAKKMREMEAIYEAERSSMTKEKEEMSNREEEMQTIIQRLKDNLSQRNDEEGPAATSPNVDNGSFAPPSSLNRSDSRNNSKLLLQKDKLIESLRLELAEAQIKLVESENQGGGRLQEVERLLMEARMANARLMEDNESYQLLLQEKTLNGDFSKNDFSYMGVSANQDALNALEGRSGGASLADELSEDASDAGGNDNEHSRRLESELKSMKDQNKALTLYINKIIERLLQHQDFEHILDTSTEIKPAANTNKDLPAPPKEGASGASLLQRAKTMAVGPNKPKQRPMSYMPSAQPANSAHTDPETAPRIPIGNMTRSSSTRRARPMSEQFTGVNLVNQMYRGPDGPISPPLGSPRTPRTSQTFFGGNPNAAARAPSGQQAPTAGNFPGMRSETSSTSGDSNDLTGTPPSQSPPRSHHEKQTTFAGNKPRPLRLVQENNEAKQENNKRSSWMGWASGWGKKEEGAAAPGSNEAIPE
ncbi:M serotype [Colletotrichum scovillei]|uniref:M serotype n=1 Tax=Colletotrichum scovillei TaxID=1209932 RepID=A0A9P7RD79_9PEZI|nr:M serotype [Colletotrichum scovillei]KAG7074530.1 M serotype [Colletotrichum scovillei]KAG7081648.1 M serotype [Colletotrichum scovillei]